LGALTRQTARGQDAQDEQDNNKEVILKILCILSKW